MTIGGSWRSSLCGLVSMQDTLLSPHLNVLYIVTVIHGINSHRWDKPIHRFSGALRLYIRKTIFHLFNGQTMCVLRRHAHLYIWGFCSCLLYL